jgi:hypothetical protein
MPSAVRSLQARSLPHICAISHPWSDTDSLDPITVEATAFILLLVCSSAAAIPAWRAAQVDPMEVLRAE